MRMFYASAAACGFIIGPMSAYNERNGGPTRVLSLTLAEGEWRNLLDVEPEPIAWLRDQIRERLENREAGAVSLPPDRSCPPVTCGLA